MLDFRLWFLLGLHVQVAFLNAFCINRWCCPLLKCIVWLPLHFKWSVTMFADYYDGDDVATDGWYTVCTSHLELPWELVVKQAFWTPFKTPAITGRPQNADTTLPTADLDGPREHSNTTKVRVTCACFLRVIKPDRCFYPSISRHTQYRCWFFIIDREIKCPWSQLRTVHLVNNHANSPQHILIISRKVQTADLWITTRH